MLRNISDLGVNKFLEHLTDQRLHKYNQIYTWKAIVTFIDK